MNLPGSIFLFILYGITLLSPLQADCQTNDSLKVKSDTAYTNYLSRHENTFQRTYRIGMTKNIFKTNLIQLVDGEFQTIWEHRFNNRFGFDIGPGLILPFSLNKTIGVNASISNDYSSKINNLYDITKLFLYNVDGFDNNKPGFSFMIEPKYYFFVKTKLRITDHHAAVGSFYHFRKYSNLLINEVGISYTYLVSNYKLFYSPSIALSYTIQTPFNQISDLKFLGNPSSTLSGHNLPYYTSLRIYIRMYLGYIFR